MQRRRRASVSCASSRSRATTRAALRSDAGRDGSEGSEGSAVGWLPGGDRGLAGEVGIGTAGDVSLYKPMQVAALARRRQGRPALAGPGAAVAAIVWQKPRPGARGIALRPRPVPRWRRWS
ncbi:exported hypothetical protein [Cupriavidus oxalaticus]|uniref:Uncharacterized protein n=1 Tax=Cupriavidus oxalaticus TaxID=96344 RepID=A0A976BFG5_9BURK|nr:exported hypothetical protein [Cupriavidus oxalaticus]